MARRRTRYRRTHGWWRYRRVPPVVWWMAVALLTVITVVTIGRTQARADAARARWGSVSTVAIAARTLEAGDVVGPADVALQDWPTGLAGPDVMSTAPIGETVAQRILAGEAIRAERLAPAGLSALAAALAPDERGLAVPVLAGALPVDLRDTVDLLADGEIVAEAGRVLAVGADATVVAVDSRAAPRVAAALATSTVLIAVRPPA